MTKCYSLANSKANSNYFLFYHATKLQAYAANLLEYNNVTKICLVVKFLPSRHLNRGLENIFLVLSTNYCFVPLSGFMTF